MTNHKKQIILIYPGFPHYRNGVIEALLESDKNTYHFAGDKRGYNEIKPYDFKDYPHFYDFPSYRIGTFWFNRGLLRFILFKKFDGAIVHSSPYWISIIIASIILKIKGIPNYNWAHGVLDNIVNLRSKLYVLFYKSLFKGLLLYGNISKDNLVRLGYKSEKITVVYNSLDYKAQIGFRGSVNSDQRKQFRASLFTNPVNSQLIFIGRLIPEKKLDMLINAAALLKNEQVIVNLLFVGDGPERENLQQLVKNKDLESQVCFYGASYDEAANYQLIYSSDCCVAPGQIGLTAIHSLMYGVPVISHNNPNDQGPEFEAIKHLKNGALFQYNDEIDLKNKILEVLQMISAKTPTEIENDCYEIVDQYYNPEVQRQLIESAFEPK
ncbi:glycosyltransferase [Muriicola sp. Z0-33]|uniref:glycosyltransferase n=1 Tax=Muriicola sp. Z0-33 TaxID=2816957 RepID=UPI002237A678|nr:glycosyltransferase [Muriicola sp. Z0-33]MCW5515601.1 glycosyltransferase [Muriicola sp. Z0-33]